MPLLHQYAKAAIALTRADIRTRAGSHEVDLSFGQRLDRAGIASINIKIDLKPFRGHIGFEIRKDRSEPREHVRWLGVGINRKGDASAVGSRRPRSETGEPCGWD